MTKLFKKRLQEIATTLPSFAWLSVFFVLPSILIFAIAFKVADSSGGIGSYWTLDTFKNVLRADYLPMIWRTIWVSFAITAICLVLAIPVGYWIARQSAKYRYWYLILVILPLWTNFLIRIFAWRIVLHPDGFFRQTLIWLGMIPSNVFLLNNVGSTIAVSVYTFLPFAVLPIYSAAEKFNFSLLEAASDLGASRLKSFCSIFLPGIKRGIYTAVLIVLIPALGSYAIPDLVGGVDGEMLGNKIAQKVTASRNLPEAAAFASILGAIITMPVLLLFLKRNKFAKNLANLMKGGSK